MTQEEKDKEAMEKTVTCSVVNYAPYHETTTIRRVAISEAARLYLDNPEVQAEVKRIQKEREIKVGDWFWCDGKGVEKCVDLIHRSPFPIKSSRGTYSHDFCTKITDPAFIALLEAGVKP